MNLNTEQDVDFSIVEERLQFSLPRELKQIYTAIHGQEEYFACAEHFLPLDEMCVEQGILVFFKKKRTPIAGYDMERGCLVQYYKREWHTEWGGGCCYQFCVGRMITIALEHKPVFKKGRCKGKFVTTLNIERELEQFCNEKYHFLSELHVYGIAVMYSDFKNLYNAYVFLLDEDYLNTDEKKSYREISVDMKEFENMDFIRREENYDWLTDGLLTKL